MDINLLDKVYRYFSPATFNKRIAARARYDYVHKRYLEAGSKSKRLTSKFNRKTSNINQDIDVFLNTIIERTQFLDDNMPYARRASSIWTSFVVGNGIRPDFTHSSSLVSQRYERVWNKWADSLECDYYGQSNLYSLQALAFRTMFNSGSCFITKSYDKTKEFPLVLQLHSPDKLDKSKKSHGKNKIIQGIEVDKYGRKVAIWFKNSEEPDLLNSSKKSIRVLADEVLHIFEVLRPSQITGIPKLTPCVVRISDYDDFSDASLVKQKIASCLVGAVHDMSGDSGGFEDQGENEDVDLPSKFTPGMWTVLPAGKTVSFNSPPTVEGMEEIESVQLRAIASGVDLPYEILANNYTRMNFSSSRMSLGTFFHIAEPFRNNQFIPQFFDGVMKWFYELCLLMGMKEGVTNTYSEMVKIYPDPYKEAMANKINVLELQIESRSALIRSKGKDPDKIFSQLKKELENLNKLINKEDKSASPDSDKKIENAIEAIQERLILLTGND